MCSGRMKVPYHPMRATKDTSGVFMWKATVRGSMISMLSTMLMLELK